MKWFIIKHRNKTETDRHVHRQRERQTATNTGRSAGLAEEAEVVGTAGHPGRGAHPPPPVALAP